MTQETVPPSAPATTALYLRNVAIIAHVDHGKTTMVDRLLYQSGMFRDSDLDKLAGGQHGLIMDSNPLERERGITILAKNCEVYYNAEDGHKYKINIIDTPGHADFGGEVERVLKMADGVILLVDSFEGPMPQTRFVLQKALENKLRPIVLINKVDRAEARPTHVVNEVFDLLIDLGADEEALDFPIIYGSGRDGWATNDLNVKKDNLRDLFEAILKYIPAPQMDKTAPLQMLVTTLAYSDYVGRIAIGRVFAGTLKKGQTVAVLDRNGKKTNQRVQQLHQFEGLGKREVDFVEAGDICAVVGLNPVDIGDTIAQLENPIALPTIKVDEPTLTMTFRVNDSPFAGQEGTYVTSRQIKERLEKELESNVALKVDFKADEFHVSGRGLMHLGILLENMRREGFELTCSKPQVIFKEEDGKKLEPIEVLVVDCPSECQNSVMSLVSERRAELIKMDAKAGADTYVHIEFTIPARGLIGLRSRLLTATQGRAIMHHVFHSYQPMRGSVPQRQAGVMVASDPGRVTAYALDGLYDRGLFFVKNADNIYEGQLVGEHCKENDIIVNVTRAKQLTNFRTTAKDDAAKIRPPRDITLEYALEYIQDDEMVEITPESIRLRKKMLKESDRKKQSRKNND